MSAIGEQLTAAKKNYDMIKFKTRMRVNDAKNNHPLLLDEDASAHQPACKNLFYRIKRHFVVLKISFQRLNFIGHFHYLFY